MPSRLDGILHDIVPGEAAASLAAVRSPGAAPDVVWRPPSLEREPAFLVYSITKTFTATVILQLVDERRLDLDGRVARWFPGVPAADRITLRQLLNHTSGIPDYGPLRAYHDAVRSSPSTPWTFERFAAETIDKPRSVPAGERFSYSNAGYMLLKRIAEDVGGASYARLIADRIARPLGLVRTFVAESTGDLAALAPASSTRLDAAAARRDVRDCYHPGWVSHGVIASTASEIARFLDALSAGRLLPPRRLGEMLDGVPVDVEGAPATAKYGLGIMADSPSRFGAIWGHNGGGPGYVATVFHAPDLGGLTMCLLAALESLDPMAAAFGALAALDDRSPRSS